MLTTNDALKILNKNKKGKYSSEQANKIKALLYQLGEIAFLQLKLLKEDEQKSDIIHKGIYRRAS